MLDDREDSQPTEGQKQAGNYQKGHVWAHGMRISIENPAGSIRTGKGADGTEWASRMQHDYGYVRGSTGRDGDHIDVFLGPDFKNRDLPVHVVDQHDPETGKFDEHKAMMGFATQKDAVDAYHANYPHDWKGAQAVTPLHVDEFKRWATSSGARHKPLATHLGVKKFAEGGSVNSEADYPTLGGFLSDPQSWRDMGRNALSLGNRLATQIAGGPADLAMLPAHVLRGLNNIGRAAVGAEPMAELPEPALGSAHFQRLAKDYLGAPTSTGDDAADALFDVSSMVAGFNPGKTARIVKAPARALRELAEAPGPAAGGRAAQRGVIKAPGGNWLNGSAEDALKGLKRRVPTPADAADTPRIPWNEQDEVEAGRISAMNNWVDKQLTRYVKNDMSTERDPLRTLAERGVLHVDPNQVGINRYKAAQMRNREGTQALGQSEAAKAWEDSADTMIQPEWAKSIVGNDSWMPKELDQRIQDNPWLTKVPGDTRVYAPSQTRDLAEGLGFDHLTDELRNALNPNSGLPRHLQLTPQQLSRVSVPQAAELVSKINDWRAEQKIAANLAKANNAATVTHMELPGGMRWVELKAPAKAPQGWVEPTQPGRRANLDPDYAYGRSALEDALKYEGDTMGHCVGGYCDDVLAGRSRIFSLRDAKGEPHATIEMAPDRSNTVKSMQDGTPSSFRIEQIKGKGNRGVAPKYQQHVLDFLHNTPHSAAEDLQLNGIFHRNQFPAIEPGEHPLPAQPLYYTADQLRALGRKVPNGYAAGGRVKHFDDGGSAGEGGGYDNGSSGLMQLLRKPVAGSGWDSDYAGDEGQARYQQDLAAYNKQQADLQASLPKLKTKDQFLAMVQPTMLGADGKFLGPNSGVNYALEGLTPEEAYSRFTATPQRSYVSDADDTSDIRYWQNEANRINSTNANLLDPSWREGPNNGGGFLGGLLRFAKDVVRIPPISMALTAGVINPAVNSALRGAGMSASTAATATPLVTGAAKTVLNGGSLLDAAKGAGINYVSGVAGQEAADSLNLPELSPAVKYLVGTTTNSTLRGKPVKLDPFGFARSLASGYPKKG